MPWAVPLSLLALHPVVPICRPQNNHCSHVLGVVEKEQAYGMPTLLPEEKCSTTVPGLFLPPIPLARGPKRMALEGDREENNSKNKADALREGPKPHTRKNS